MKNDKNLGKLLLIGPGNSSIHLKNYYNLICNFFTEVLVISNESILWTEHRIVDFSLKNPLQFLKEIRSLKKILNDFEPDLIHVHQINSAALLTVRANKKKIPLILTAWGTDVLVLPEKNYLMKKMVKYCLKNANYITADAQYMLDKIETLSKNKNLVLANFGIEYEEITFPLKEKVIYSNRSHSEIYNINLIIEGSVDFLKLNKDWKLIIGAHGQKSEELKSLAKQKLPEDQYEFIGYLSQKENQRQYLKAKIYVSIPNTDGTSISLLEAMGYGCIPIVSDLPANREWIKHKENGIIYEGNLFRAYKTALCLDQQKVQSMNKQIIKEKATRAVNLNKFIEIYRKLK